MNCDAMAEACLLEAIRVTGARHWKVNDCVAGADGKEGVISNFIERSNIDVHIRVQDACHRALDPDEYFASHVRETDACDLIVFASRDESVFGRCAQLMRIGTTDRSRPAVLACAVTVVDSRMTGELLGGLISEMGVRIGAMNADKKSLKMLRPDPNIIDHHSFAEGDAWVYDDLEGLAGAGHDRLFGRVTQFLFEDLRTVLETNVRGWPRDALGMGPDMLRMFSGTTLGEPTLLRPVEKWDEYKHTVGKAGAISLAGGAVQVALADATDMHWRHTLVASGAHDAQAWNANLISKWYDTLRSAGIGGATVQGTSSARVLVQPGDRLVNCDNVSVRNLLDGTVVYLVRGVPLSHVASVLECFVAMDNVQDIAGMLRRALDRRSLVKLADIKRARSDAAAAIARSVDAHLASIKAHLWRPHGPLHVTQLNKYHDMT